MEFHEEIAARENAIREQKVAIVLKRIMHGDYVSRFHWVASHHPAQQAVLPQAAGAQARHRRRRYCHSPKRKTLVALAWRAWKYQMVDQDKLASVKQMLSKRLSAAKGTYLARWWAYVEHRRRKLEKFSVAVDLHRRWQKRAAFNQWIESVHAASTEMEAKLAKAMEWAFGASLSLTMSKWRALVKGEKQRKMAMQRMVGLLTGFGLDNLGVHVLHAWREVCLEKQRGTAHLRKADNHRRARVLDQAFLSWKIQSMPLSDADHAKMLGQGADDVWDHDYDDKGDTTQVHAQVLVRRTRAMFDGLNPDSDEDTQDLIEEDRRATPGTGMRGVMSRAMKISQSGAGRRPKPLRNRGRSRTPTRMMTILCCRRREGWGGGCPPCRRRQARGCLLQIAGCGSLDRGPSFVRPAAKRCR